MKEKWLLMTRGDFMSSKNFFDFASTEGIRQSASSKPTGGFCCRRLAIRNRNQVLPDLGYETRNVSSGRTFSDIPGWTRRVRILAAETNCLNMSPQPGAVSRATGLNKAAEPPTSLVAKTHVIRAKPSQNRRGFRVST